MVLKMSFGAITVYTLRKNAAYPSVCQAVFELPLYVKATLNDVLGAAFFYGSLFFVAKQFVVYGDGVNGQAGLEAVQVVELVGLAHVWCRLWYLLARKIQRRGEFLVYIFKAIIYEAVVQLVGCNMARNRALQGRKPINLKSSVPFSSMTFRKSPKIIKSGGLLLICLGFLQNGEVVAEDRLSIKGFGTIAGIGTDTDSVNFRRDITLINGTRKNWNITNDSRLGIQVDAKFTDALQATVQWVARNREGDFLEQNLEWAFLSWNIHPDLTLRMGRLGADVFMLSDYRNVSYAYPWIRPPHEFYANIPYFHFDGVDITKKFDWDGGLLSVKAFGGYSLNQLPTSLDILYDQESLNLGGTVQYEKNDWRFKAGYAYLKMLSEVPFHDYQTTDFPVDLFINPANRGLVELFWPGVGKALDNLYIKDKEVNYIFLGMAYDDSVWLAQAEMSYTSTNTTWYPSQASGYINFGRRFSSLMVYSLFGITKSVYKDVVIPKPPAGLGDLNAAYTALDSAINKNGVDEKSVSLGLRWDFYTNMAFKAQWSHFWLGKDGDRTWGSNTNAAFPDHVNVFSVGVDFIF